MPRKQVTEEERATIVALYRKHQTVLDTYKAIRATGSSLGRGMIERTLKEEGEFDRLGRSKGRRVAGKSFASPASRDISLGIRGVIDHGPESFWLWFTGVFEAKATMVRSKARPGMWQYLTISSSDEGFIRGIAQDIGGGRVQVVQSRHALARSFRWDVARQADILAILRHIRPSIRYRGRFVDQVIGDIEANFAVVPQYIQRRGDQA